MRNLLSAFTLLGSSFTGFAEAKTCAETMAPENPWVRETIANSPTTAAYLTLANKGDALCILSSAKTTAAKRVELHEHLEQDGMMKMRQVSSILLPKQSQTALNPGGLHIMLFDLNAGLKAGDNINIVLQYDDKSQQTVVVPVKADNNA